VREIGVAPDQVALAWLSTRGVVPILGPRTAQQLRKNLGATVLQLPPEHAARLDAASAIPLGFPHDFLADARQRNRLNGRDENKMSPLERPVA